MQILPDDVPFYHLDIREVPEIATDAEGYFAQLQYADYLDHGKHGAGGWSSLNEYNCIGDKASMPWLEQPWLDGGSFTW